MAKTAQNARKTWSSAEVNQLKDLVNHNTPTGLIAHKLGRSESAVSSKAHAEGISLKPANRSPYG